MRRLYYAYHPRNFANEYTIYSVEDEADREAIEKLERRISGYPDANLRRITTKELLDMQREERHRQMYDRAFAGNCHTTPIPAREMDER